MVRRLGALALDSVSRSRAVDSQSSPRHRKSLDRISSVDLSRVRHSSISFSLETEQSPRALPFSLPWGPPQVPARPIPPRYASDRSRRSAVPFSAFVLVFSATCDLVDIFQSTVGRNSLWIDALGPRSLVVSSHGFLHLVDGVSLEISTALAPDSSQKRVVEHSLWRHNSALGYFFQDGRFGAQIIFASALCKIFSNQGSTTRRNEIIPGRSIRRSVPVGQPNHRTTASVFKINGKSVALTCGPANLKRSSSWMGLWGTYISCVGTRMKMSSKSKLKKFGTLEKSSFLACGLHLFGLKTKTWSFC